MTLEHFVKDGIKFLACFAGVLSFGFILLFFVNLYQKVDEIHDKMFPKTKENDSEDYDDHV